MTNGRCKAHVLGRRHLAVATLEFLLLASLARTFSITLLLALAALLTGLSNHSSAYRFSNFTLVSESRSTHRRGPLRLLSRHMMAGRDGHSGKLRWTVGGKSLWRWSRWGNRDTARRRRAAVGALAEGLGAVVDEGL